MPWRTGPGAKRVAPLLRQCGEHRGVEGARRDRHAPGVGNSGDLAQVGQAASLLFTRCGDDKYDVAVAVARSLGRGVISPQDPTIAYQANRYFGHALYFELDAHTINGEWPARLPEAMETEIKRASYVIEVRTHVPTTVLNHSLNQNQFHPVDVPDLEGSAYVLWAKSRD